MKIRNYAAATVAIGLAAGSAGAADVGRGPYYSAPTYAPATVQTYSWMGPYLGFNVGYQWGTVTNSPTNPSGFAGGIQGGYNFQTGQFVFGGETDLQWSGAEDTFAGWKFSNPWFGTLRARAGVAINNILLYGTGGMAYGDVRNQFAGASETHTHVGWTAGLGIEVGLTPNWSVKGEYLYLATPDTVPTPPGTRINGDVDTHLFRIGLNYHF